MIVVLGGAQAEWFVDFILTFITLLVIIMHYCINSPWVASAQMVETYHSPCAWQALRHRVGCALPPSSPGARPKVRRLHFLLHEEQTCALMLPGLLAWEVGAGFLFNSPGPQSASPL